MGRTARSADPRRTCRTGAHAASRVVTSLPAGCHGVGESEASDEGPEDGREEGREGRPTRTSTRSIRTPATSARRAVIVPLRNFTWVAHAGSSASTTSTPSSRRTGRTCAATVGPTASSQRPKTPPIWMRSVPRNDFMIESSDREIGTGSAMTANVPGHSWVTCPAITRSTWSARAAEGSSLAVVITTCPAGR